MAKKQSSFEMVMALVLPRYRELSGHNEGVMTWLAGGLRVTKQAMTGFRNRGRFPSKYLLEISALADIPMAELQPILDAEIAQASRQWRTSLRETELRLICIGLDNLNRK